MNFNHETTKQAERRRGLMASRNGACSCNLEVDPECPSHGSAFGQFRREPPLGTADLLDAVPTIAPPDVDVNFIRANAEKILADLRWAWPHLERVPIARRACVVIALWLWRVKANREKVEG